MRRSRLQATCNMTCTEQGTLPLYVPLMRGQGVSGYQPAADPPLFTKLVLAETSSVCPNNWSLESLKGFNHHKAADGRFPDSSYLLSAITHAESMQPAHDSPICPGWHGTESITHEDGFKCACAKDEAAAVRQQSGRSEVFPKEKPAGCNRSRSPNDQRRSQLLHLQNILWSQKTCVTAQRPLPVRTHMAAAPKSFISFVCVCLPASFVYLSAMQPENGATLKQMSSSAHPGCVYRGRAL